MMNKNQLAKAISVRTEVPVRTVMSVLDELMLTVTETAAAGDEIRLTGFGTFGRRRRGERKGRNPKTGEIMMIPAKYAPYFKPGERFARAVETGKVSE